MDLLLLPLCVHHIREVGVQYTEARPLFLWSGAHTKPSPLFPHATAAASTIAISGSH